MMVLAAAARSEAKLEIVRSSVSIFFRDFNNAKRDSNVSAPRSRDRAETHY